MPARHCADPGASVLRPWSNEATCSQKVASQAPVSKGGHLGVAHGVGEALPLEPRGFPFEALGLLEVLCVLFPQASDVETRCGRPLDNSPAEICSGLLNVRVPR